MSGVLKIEIEESLSAIKELLAKQIVPLGC
jgi:hypothetical protein